MMPMRWINFSKTVVLYILFLHLSTSFAKSEVDVAACKAALQQIISMHSMGAHFLHSRDQSLHNTPEVVRVAAERGLKATSPPISKISLWLNDMATLFGSAADPTDVAKRGGIKTHFRDLFVAKPENIPASYFDGLKRVERQRGNGNAQLTPKMREELIENVIANQTKSLDRWLDYFLSSDSAMYPIWTKYWALMAIGKMGLFDAETGTFRERSKGTMTMFPELNREAFAIVIDAVVKKARGQSLSDIEDPEFLSLVSSGNFSKLYGYALKSSKARTLDTSSIDGKWILYKRGSDPMNQTAISEVRGVGQDQNLDSVMASTGVLDRKLVDFGSEGDKYKVKSQNMKTLTDIEKKVNRQEKLTEGDLRFLYEVDQPITGFGYQKDPRIAELISTRDPREDLFLAMEGKYAREEIGITADDVLNGGGKIKWYHGDLDLDLSKIPAPHTFSFPTTVNGSLSIRLTGIGNVKTLILPQKVNGTLSIRGIKTVQELKLPKTVNGSLWLNDLVSANLLKLPEIVEGEIYLINLESVIVLNLPDKVTGGITLERLRAARDLIFPKILGGDLELRALLIAENTKLPEIVNGSLFLNTLQSLRGIRLPLTVTGNVYLTSLQSTEGLTVIKKAKKISIPFGIR